MQDFTKGFDNSGGWRFKDKKSSNDFLSSIYSPEAYNGGLLDSVGNPNRGALDKALAVKPIDNIITTGLLEERGGGGSFGGVSDNAESVNSDGGAYSDKAFSGMEGLLGGLAGFALGGPMGAATGYATGGSLSNQRQAGFADSASVGVSEAASRAAAQARSTEAQAQAEAQAAVDAGLAFADAVGMGATGGSGGAGDYGGGYGGGGSGTASDGGYGGDSSHGTAGWAKGGPVTKGRLTGPNPSGPDDGYGALDGGEFVVKASSVKKYGKGLLSDINNGTFKR